MTIETVKETQIKRAQLENQVDAVVRKIQETENHWQVMMRILECLTDKQLQQVKKIAKIYIRAEKKNK